MSVVRRRAVGAEVAAGGVHFRVWAPSRQRVEVVIGDRRQPLEREAGGYFAGLVTGAGAGTLYRFLLDDDPQPYPDPASRFQPQGPHGASQVVDPDAYRWRAKWHGIQPSGLVIYEMHIGTFTPEGTWAAAAAKLSLVAEVGVNVVEIMPVSEFPGRFGWGYDGVDLWAPTRLYGTPDDFRRFVDAAHDLGLGVILDVVYNHLGPDGCYLTKYTPAYFTDRYKNDWGAAVNFDGEHAAGDPNISFAIFRRSAPVIPRRMRAISSSRMSKSRVIRRPLASPVSAHLCRSSLRTRTTVAGRARISGSPVSTGAFSSRPVATAKASA